jgi:hypothetical protein
MPLVSLDSGAGATEAGDRVLFDSTPSVTPAGDALLRMRPLHGHCVTIALAAFQKRFMRGPRLPTGSSSPTRKSRESCRIKR